MSNMQGHQKLLQVFDLNKLYMYKDKHEARFNKTLFFHVLTCHRWGHDIAEFKSVLTHSHKSNYDVVFIVESHSRNAVRLRKLRSPFTYSKYSFICISSLLKHNNENELGYLAIAWRTMVTNRSQLERSMGPQDGDWGACDGVASGVCESDYDPG